MSQSKSNGATSSGSCRPTATAVISAPASAAARSTSTICARSRSAADQLGYYGVLLPTGSIMRGFLDRRLLSRAVHRAAARSRGGQARPAIAKRGRAHDRDARPHHWRPAPRQRRHRRRSRREQGRRHLPRPTTSATRSPASSSTSIATCSRARPSMSRASTSASRMASCCSRRCSRRARHSISAARRMPASTSRSTPSTNISPGANRRPGRREDREGEGGRGARAAENCPSASGFMCIVRETNDEAWRAAGELIERHVDDETIATGAEELLRAWTRSASSAWRSSTAASATSLEIAPNLWAGVGLLARRRRHRRWSATPRPSPRASGSIRISASIPSSCRATRIWRRPIALPSWSSRCSRWSSLLT